MDRTVDGRRLKLLTMVDEHTRESLAIHVDRHIKAKDVVDILARIVRERGVPRHVRSDNGPEFVEPGSPWENAHVESFNGKLADELLDIELFGSIAEARYLIEEWRADYNHRRPHSSLGYMTPAEYAACWSASGQPANTPDTSPDNLNDSHSTRTENPEPVSR